VLRRSIEPSEYSSGLFGAACRSLGVVQSMGRVGSALDNAAAESFFSTLEHELLARRQFATRDEARTAVAGWIDGFYNRIRRHSSTGMRSPVDYELAATAGTQAA
jgi:putative transposase